MGPVFFKLELGPPFASRSIGSRGLEGSGPRDSANVRIR